MGLPRKLSAEQVREIRKNAPRHGVRTGLAARYGVHHETVRRVLRRQTYKGVRA